MNPLVPGDIVDIIAPASACSKEELANAVRVLKQLGLKPRVPKLLLGKTILFSNSDEVRLEHLKRALFARDSAMIWCLRGGYGSIRLMPEVLKWKAPPHKKIFLGYSDVTTLHVHFNQKWKWPTLHGPLFDRLGKGLIENLEKELLFGILSGELSEIEFTNLKPLNKKALVKKRISGQVLGGNLATLQSGLGTPSALNPKGSILFLEDRGEKPHRIDRMLTQMTQAGWFKKAQAVVLGYFEIESKTDEKIIWQDVISRFANDCPIPVVAGLPVGHNPELQMTLPFGIKSSLSLNLKKAALLVPSPIGQA